MLFLVFSCFPKKSSRELKNSREISTYRYIIGGTEGNTINFLLLSKEKHYGESFLFVYDKNYRIKAEIKCESVNSYLPVFCTDDYLVIGRFRNINTGSRDFIVYDDKQQNFNFIPIDYHLIWNLFIFKDNLFYASEMANPHLNVVNLRTGEQKHFNEFYCPCAEFGLANNNVYACYENKEYFVFDGELFIKLEKGVSDFKSEFYEVKDFQIDDSIISKLHY